MISELVRLMRPYASRAPLLLFIGSASFWLGRGELRWEHVAMVVILAVLASGNPFMRRLYFGLLPLGLVALLYDAMRFVRNVGLAGRVHGCDVRRLELELFGVAPDLTMQDWFELHPKVWLDALCAIPYGLFLFAVVGYAVFLFVRDFPAQQRFAWGFFLVNLAGFLTYHLCPTAPPWWLHQHGCTIDLSGHSSAGSHLLRVDRWLGIPYFEALYGRASDVFGAIPSLHVAYPLLMLIEGARNHGRAGIAALVAFYAAMCFSAIYLDHHWVVDLVAGSVYAILTALALRWLLPDPSPGADAPVPALAVESEA
jgi:hypothetical protein